MFFFSACLVMRAREKVGVGDGVLVSRVAAVLMVEFGVKMERGQKKRDKKNLTDD
jgi:hypothetical protein